MDKNDQTTAEVSKADRNPTTDTIESGSSIKDSSHASEDVADQSEQIKGIVR